MTLALHGKSQRRISLLLLVAMLGIAGAALIAASQSSRFASAQGNEDKVTICHRTASHTNPYVVITVDANAADGEEGQGQGDHAHEHQGPIWFEGIEGEWGDIIPPHGTFPGLNWDAAGMAIHANDCAAVAETPTEETPTEVTPSVTPTTPVTETGSITVIKDAGEDTTTVFDFTFNGTPFDLVGGGSELFDDLDPGMYSIVELDHADFSLIDTTCVGAVTWSETVDGALVTLAAGEDVTCTVTNAPNPVEATSNVTIVKSAGGAANSIFTFTVAGLAGLTDFTLDDDPATGGVGNSMLIPGLSDDQFTVTEGETAGWMLTNIVCTEGGSADLTGIATVSVAGGNVAFDIPVEAGLNITCTFTNALAETPTVTPTTPVTETATASPTTPTTETPTVSPTTPVTESPTASPTTPTVTETTTTAPSTPDDDDDGAPVTSTAEGVTQEAVAGATPIAPSTGTGSSAAEQTATLALVIAGLVAMTAGATLFTIRRRS